MFQGREGEKEERKKGGGGAKGGGLCNPILYFTREDYVCESMCQNKEK